MTNHRLPPELLLIVFSKLQSPRDLAACAQVCKSWFLTSNDQALWQKWCINYWLAPPPTSDRENAKEKDKEKFLLWQAFPVEVQKNARQVFIDWYTQFRQFRDIYPVLKNVAYRLSNWLKVHSPSTFLTLLPGRQAAEWETILAGLSQKLDFNHAQIPSQIEAFLLFYHFFDGQKPRMPHVDAGLFGTFSCYGQYTSLFVFPSRHIRKEVVWGLSLAVFAVCPRSGRYLSLVMKAPLNEELLYHVVEVDETRGQYISHGYFLDFLTKYVNDLENEIYDVREPEGAISMFRNSGPFTSVCETNVLATSMPQLEAGAPTGVWVYRIKLSYVGGIAAPPSCQLQSRNWVIKYMSGHVAEVKGEAVVGQFPELGRHRPFYDYCSLCTGRNPEQEGPVNPMAMIQNSDPAIWMEGEFTMIPGTIAAPAGEPFQVKVARFYFVQPTPIKKSPEMTMDILNWEP